MTSPQPRPSLCRPPAPFDGSSNRVQPRWRDSQDRLCSPTTKDPGCQNTLPPNKFGVVLHPGFPMPPVSSDRVRAPTMNTVTTAAAVEARPPDQLPAEVLNALVAAAQEGLRRLDTGCLLHSTGRTRWLGLSANVKAVLFEHHYGRRAPSGSNLVRTCATSGCVEPTHLFSVSRREFGRWLGRPGGGWRPPRVA